ncbi:MAG TPA: hypothetical protein VH796_18150 [Nitrososphaeraceae archaeon]
MMDNMAKTVREVRVLAYLRSIALDINWNTNNNIIPVLQQGKRLVMLNIENKYSVSV